VRFIKIIVKWFFPKIIIELIVFIRNFISNKTIYKKDWSYEPLNLLTHSLPFFELIDKNPFWASLNKETRPSISFTKSVKLKFKINQNELGNEFQFAIGKLGEKPTNIVVKVNNKIISTIKNLENNIWIDIRILINEMNGDLVIESDSNEEIFVSHPIIVRKQIEIKNPIKNIICIVLDGVNQSHFNTGSESTTSNIDSFFSEGISCNQAFAQSDWTLPAFSSMLSGLYPINHGVYNPDKNDSILPEETKTLPELLLAEGYRTFGYSSHSRFSPAYGHSRGFERFIYRKRSQEYYYPQIITDTISHLESHKNENNFIFIHFFDTHAPYFPYSYLQNNFLSNNRDYNAYDLSKKFGLAKYEDKLIDLGNAKLKEVDQALAQLFTYFKNQSWHKDSHFILTADHGLPFKKEKMNLLDHARVNIPLFVKGPKIPNHIEPNLIEGSVDLLPSIMTLAGAKVPDNIDGKIWPFIGGDIRNQILSESLYLDKYNLSIRSKKSCFYYHSSFNYINNKIGDFDNNNIKKIIRKNGIELETEYEKISETEKRTITNYIKNHIK